MKNVLIVNFKNYPEVLGAGAAKLAAEAERAAEKTGADIVVAPPSPSIALVASRVGIPVFAQSLDPDEGDRTTGAFIPEAARAFGATGSILNHSEARVGATVLKRLIPRLKVLSLKSCVCARTSREAGNLSGLKPDFIAVEPPELIGSGVAVSKARPRVVSSAVADLRERGFRGKVLCGAGITDGADVAKALELGADGVLVSSAIVKAPDWGRKLEELARSL
jgi:triosephosphate isomerase (TIM)